MEEAKGKAGSCPRKLSRNGSKTLAQTHLGSFLGIADTTACFSLPHPPPVPSHAEPAGRQAACLNPCNAAEVRLPTNAMAPLRGKCCGQWELLPVLVTSLPPGQVAFLHNEVLLALLQLQVLHVHRHVVVEGHHLLHLACCAVGQLRGHGLHHHLPQSEGERGTQ